MFRGPFNERKVEAYSRWYVETLSETRTKLAGFFNIPWAEVAELADALDSGSSALTGVRVQIPASAPTFL